MNQNSNSKAMHTSSSKLVDGDSSGHPTIVVTTINDMRKICENLSKRDSIIKLVPTMGALHEGHSKLILEATKEDCSKDDESKRKSIVITSIFVNPLQFNNPEDLTNYPSTWSDDFNICKNLKVDYIFKPSNEEMYNSEDSIKVVPIARYADCMEGKSRPGHFIGVLTVVSKLFNIIRPHQAFFGEKDYQQLKLVERMSKDLNMNVQIIPVATVRDIDWLPLSSRNRRLGSRQRKLAATVISRLLKDMAIKFDMFLNQVIFAETDRKGALKDFLNSIKSNSIASLTEEDKKMIEIDYLEVRSETNFQEIIVCEKSGRILIKGSEQKDGIPNEFRFLTAVIVDGIRLLDNIKVYVRQTNLP